MCGTHRIRRSRRRENTSAKEWRASDSDNAAIVALTYRYLAAEDAGNLDEANALMEPSMMAAVPDWRATVKYFNSVAGGVKTRTIRAINWEKDPVRASAPGVYVSVDFVGQFENVDIECGYVSWHRQADGSYLAVHEENGFLDKKAAARLDEKSLAATKSAFHCVDAPPAPVPNNSTAQCHPIAPEEIAKQWKYYNAISDAQPLNGNDKYECISIKRTSQVICRTLPANPAHPSIIIRTVEEDNKNVSIRTEADTAGDCKAFLDMMEQYKGLDKKIADEAKAH